MQWVGIGKIDLPTYEGLPNLAYFLEQFEEKVTESQRLSALDYVPKDMPARWRGTHKKSISEWPQCKTLMEIIFGKDISFPDLKYTSLIDSGKHIENCRTVWKEHP